MFNPGESVKIGDHLFTLVLNERVGPEQISYISISTPHVPIASTKAHTGTLVTTDDDGPKVKVEITTPDNFCATLKDTVAEMRKTEGPDNSSMLCNSLSAVDTRFRGPKSEKPPIKTTTYDFSGMDVGFTGEYFNNGAPGGLLNKMVIPVFTRHKFMQKIYAHVNAVVVWRIYIDGTAEKVDISQVDEEDDDDMAQLMRRMNRV